MKPLAPFFAPRSVAVIGATPGSAGEAALRGLLAAEPRGPIMPVSDVHPSLLGLLCHRGVAELPVAPDLAVLCGPAAPETVDALGRRGTRAAIVLAPVADPAPLLAAARRHGVRLLGPDSSGVQVPAARLNASAFVGARPGRVALLSQSGSLVAGMLAWAESRAIGFSHVVACGAGLDVDLGDLLDHFTTDDEVRALLLFVRSLDDGRKFLSAARAFSRVKPILAIMPRGERDAVFDVAFQRAGMLRARDIDELFDAAATLTHGLRPSGERLVIVSNGAGPGEMALGTLREAGGGPAELVDLGRHAAPRRYRETLGALLEDPAQPTLLVLHTPNALSPDAACAAEVIAALAGRERFVLTCWLGADRSVHRRFAESGIASYVTPEKATRAFLKLLEYRRNQYLLSQTPSTAPSAKAARRVERARALVAAALAAGRSALDPSESAALLASYDIDAAAGAAILTDPTFGRVLQLGGALALPPLNAALAGELIARAGVTPADEQALRWMLVRLADLVVDLPEVAELRGARVTLEPDPSRRPPLAIRPYPAELEEELTLKDGRTVLARPVRAEDEPAYTELLRRTDPGGVPSRLGRVGLVALDVALQLVHIDYDRQMTFVAARPGPGGATEIIAVVDTLTSPDNREAEYSLLVRADERRGGLARALLEKMIRYCRARGTERIFAMVAKDDVPMLSLAFKLGFQPALDSDAPGDEVEKMQLELS